MQTLRWLWLIGMLLILSACAGPQAAQVTVEKISLPSVQFEPKATPLATATQTPQMVLATARNAIGAPYRYGGTNLNGFDCSGLTSYAYDSAGVSIPRRSSDQFQHATKIPLHNLQAGDLLFFRLSPPKVSHVAIYDSNGRFIHAPSSGKRVSYGSLDNPYWRKHLVAAGRF